MKKLFLICISLCFYSAIAQDNYSQFWEQLLANDRASAEKTLKKIKPTNTIENLVSNELMRVENGRFNTNDKFLPAFLKQDNYQYYLYALWNENYLFNTYLDTGFNNKNIAAIREVADANPTHSTIKDAIIYLESVLARDNGNWKTCNAKMDDIQSIKNWQYCGVFENLNKSGLDRVYGPETNAVSSQPFDAESNGFVNWYTAKNNDEAYQFFTNHEEYGRGVNYAQTFLTADKDETVILRIGSGSAFKLWLNDVLILENNQDVITELNAYQVKVTIPKGNNRLLIKTAESDYGSYFIVSAMNPDGTHNNSLKDSATYTAYNTSTADQLNAEPVVNDFEAFFKTKLEQNPNDFFNAYCLTRTYLRNSKYEDAKKVLAPFYAKYPKSSLIRKMMISVYSLEEDYTSIQEINTNMELDDEDYYLPILMKVIVFDELTRMSLSDLEEYLEKLKKAIDLEMMHETADFIYNARKEDKAKVRKNLDNLMKMADGNVKLILRYSGLYASLFEEDDKTIKILEDLANEKFDLSIVRKLVTYYDRRNQKDKVIKILSNEIEYLGNDNYYLRSIINKLHKYQKYKESIKYIDQGLENFPDSFVFQELKGDALLQLNKKKEAIVAYEASLSHNSNDKSLRKKLKDLNNENNVLKDLVIEDAYDLINERRGNITTNNYGFNILHDNSTVELYSEGGGNYRYVFIYEITSDNGVERFKEYDLGLSGNYNINKSEIVKKDKSIVPADKSGSSFVFNGLSVGDVIYLDYEYSFSKTGRFYKTYSDRFMLGSFHPTLSSSIKIITPKDYKLNYKSVNGNTQPKISSKGDSKLYEWTILDNPGLPQGEDYMPSDSDIAEYIHLSTIDNWNEISIWYSDLVRSVMEVNSTVEETFNTLFPNGYKQLSEDDRAKIIYNYIRNNFTYSYVSFRQSGFVPQKPSKTIKTNLGDCKDFSTLFVTLAKKAELEANLVLVLTSDYGYNSLVLPSTDFNHCIAKVKIDGKDQFLELTDKYLPYKSLPTSLRGATGLEIPLDRNDTKTYDLFRLENLSRETAISKNSVTLNLKKDKIGMVIDSEYTGHINSYYSSVFSEPNAEVVKKTIYDDYDNRLDDDFVLNSVSNIERVNDDMLIKYTSDMTLNKKINKIGSTSVLQLPIVSNPYTSSIVSLETREHEIDYMLYENMDVYEVDYTINIEEGQQFTEIPENVSLTFKGHSYSITYTKVKDNQLQVVIKSTPSINRIKASDYAGFKGYVQNVLDAQEAFIGYK
ncbi:DUF3857 domain-containing protein [Olleya sp. YS]|uniref:DUF3857 domain-containing protein n=1 Tax=Olleya sp. YS TaxID=3028318 RepID=UPI00243423B5|nr:DUF3857 domain-containing protein [Olleya sp. YS]WGD34713.1 DUF3857 domain-containing protein [Olleya sp. YS]